MDPQLIQLARIIQNNPEQDDYGNGIIRDDFSAHDLVEQILGKYWYRAGPGFAQDPIDYIMRSGDEINSLLAEIITILGLEKYVERTTPLPDQINLLWNLYWMKYSKDREITLPLTQQKPEIIRGRYSLLLGNLSNLDLAILFYTGRFPHHQGLKLDSFGYTPFEIVKIVRYLYRHPTPQRGASIPFSSYYEEMSRHQDNESPLIPFILNWEEGTDPSDIAAHLGMLFPPHIQNLKRRIEYFVANIVNYQDIYTRPDPAEAPPNLDQVSYVEVLTLFPQYTDDELLNAYQDIFPPDWQSRHQLILYFAERASG